MLKKLLDRPVAVTMAVLVVAVLGMVSMRLLPMSLIPDVDIPYVTVQVSAPDMSAREIDGSVLKPLRQQLMQMNGLSDMVCRAKDGSGQIRLTFDYGSDIDYLFIEVNEKIDRTMPSLPQIDRPRAIKANATDIPAFYVNVTGTGNGISEYLCVYDCQNSSTVDILNPRITDAFLALTHEKYFERFGAEFGKGIAGFFTDEPQYFRYETAYTPVLLTEYKKAYRADVLDLLGALFVDCEEAPGFRFRYWRLMNVLYTENFMGRVYRWCLSHNCHLTGHTV